MKNIVKNTVSLVKNWWLILISGILLIVSAFLLVSKPFDSYVSLASIFSFLVLGSGVVTIYNSIVNRKDVHDWIVYLAIGILELILGATLIYYPAVSVVLLPTFIGFWMLFKSFQLILISLKMKSYKVMDWGWFLAAGIAASVLSLFMIYDPIFGFMSTMNLTFMSLLIVGVTNVWISFRLKDIKVQVTSVVDSFKNTYKKNVNSFKTEIINGFDGSGNSKKLNGELSKLELSHSK